MNPVIERQLAPLRAKWSVLPVRDRRALLLLGSFFAVVLLWLLLVSPFLGWQSGVRERLVTAQEDLAWMQQNAALAQQVGNAAPAGPAGGQSPATLVSSAARQAGINLQRFEPDGDARVRVSLEKVAFVDLMRWLVTLEQRHGLVVQSLSADSDGSAGLVSARLTLGWPE